MHHHVEGSGKIEVDFRNMPREIRAAVSAGGLFKEVSMTRNLPMTQAESADTRIIT